MIVPGADDGAVIGPNYSVGDRHGRGDALEPDCFGWRAVLDTWAVDGRLAPHGHRGLGVHFAKPWRGGLAVVPTDGRI